MNKVYLFFVVVFFLDIDLFLVDIIKVFLKFLVYYKILIEVGLGGFWLLVE